MRLFTLRWEINKKEISACMCGYLIGKVLVLKLDYIFTKFEKNIIG